MIKTIFICDDNTNSLEVLSLTINKEPQFRVVAQAHEGKTALTLIECHRPDIIILDIVMPEYDGVYIVNHVRKNMRDYTPIIYVLSGMGTDSVVRMLNELGVDYYSMKPVPMNVIVNNLNNLVKQHIKMDLPIINEDGKLENAIKNMFLRLGIVPHHTSSKCITEAMFMYAQNPGLNPSLTKELYPAVAKKHGLSSSSVEKNIRSAISRIQKNKTDMYREIFAYPTKERITNGEFLSVMSDYINKSVKR